MIYPIHALNILGVDPYKYYTKHFTLIQKDLNISKSNTKTINILLNCNLVVLCLVMYLDYINDDTVFNTTGVLNNIYVKDVKYKLINIFSITFTGTELYDTFATFIKFESRIAANISTTGISTYKHRFLSVYNDLVRELLKEVRIFLPQILTHGGVNDVNKL